MNERLNELHLAMGESLENLMLSLAIVCQTKPLQEINREFLDMTFGQKINALKRICGGYRFGRDDQPHIDRAFDLLERILPKRNQIVHGSTYEIGIGDAEPTAYRIGAPRGNLEYMNEFLKNPQVAHSFTAVTVRRTTAECIECTAELGTVVVAMLSPAPSQNVET